MPERLSHAAPSEPLGASSELYPDVVRAGSLRSALQGAVDRTGHRFVVELRPPPSWRHVAAQVRGGGRSAGVLMARQERCFIMDCWAGSVRMATGETDDLSEVADAMHFWMRAPLVRALVEQWPFLRT
jgi:hypothetical protein